VQRKGCFHKHRGKAKDQKGRQSMNSKVLAFLAYLLSFIGALYVLFARRKDEFAVYHAKQSLGIAIIALAVFIAWVVVGWIISWIPYVGFIFAMALFSLVIAAYILLTISCITGMVNALQMKQQPVLVIGDWILQQSSKILST
jgi:uncharacterized membrane protein